LKVLQDVAIKEGLTKKPVASRDRIVEGLLTNKLPEKRVVANDDDPPTLKEIGKKKPISKSDFWQMWQHYNLSVIVEYCRENNIKASGTKKEVIERILAWREADKENRKKFEVKEEVLARVSNRKKSVASEKKENKKNVLKEKPVQKEKKLLESDDEDEEEETVVKSKETPKEKVKSEEAKGNSASKRSNKDVKNEEPKTEVKKTTKVEEPVRNSKGGKKTKVVVEDEESEEKEVEEGEEKEEELESINSISEESQFDIIDNPEKYTRSTLIRLCKFNDAITVTDSVKTREDYINLINNTVLDLGKLEKYSLESLKAYAKDAKLEVQGKTKKAYCDAILAEQTES